MESAASEEAPSMAANAGVRLRLCIEFERGLERRRVGWVIRGLEINASMIGLEKDEGRENEGNREGSDSSGWVFNPVRDNHKLTCGY